MYILKMTDGTNTVDFLSDYTWLNDSGFNVGLFTKRQLWTPRMKGGEEVVQSYDGNRKATLKLVVRSTSRDGVATQLSAIAILINTALTRQLTGYGPRVELQYQWDTTTYKTYFEVYDGDIEYPDFLMSPEGVLRVESVKKLDTSYATMFCLHEVVLSLEIHPYGYRISPVNGSPIAIPLTNTLGGPTTSPLTVQNLFGSNCNYVELNANDLPGDQPLVTSISIANTTAGSLNNIFMGLKVNNLTFPSVFEAENAPYMFGSKRNLANVNCSNGNYSEITSSLNDSFPNVAWEFTNANIKGIFQAFAVGLSNTSFPTTALYSVGCIDYTVNYIKKMSEFKRGSTSIVKALNLGTVTLPPFDLPPSITTTDYWMGFTIVDPALTISQVDYVALLPVDNGFRMLKRRGQYYVPTMVVDDGWNNTLIDQIGTTGYGSFYGMLEPLKLQPKVTQRLYFLFDSVASCTVQVSAVPTYKMLAV